jgi:hypothetical protein
VIAELFDDELLHLCNRLIEPARRFAEGLRGDALAIELPDAAENAAGDDGVAVEEAGAPSTA